MGSPPPRKGPEMRKNCTNQQKILKLTLFLRGGGETQFDGQNDFMDIWAFLTFEPFGHTSLQGGGGWGLMQLQGCKSHFSAPLLERLSCTTRRESARDSSKGSAFSRPSRDLGCPLFLPFPQASRKTTFNTSKGSQAKSCVFQNKNHHHRSFFRHRI